MPKYNYKCNICCKQFTVFHDTSDKAECECGSKSLKKIFSAVTIAKENVAPVGTNLMSVIEENKILHENFKKKTMDE